MGCCGKKRAEWLRETRAAALPEPEPSHRDSAAELPGLFRYIGSGQLTVEGVHSRNIYRFTFPGETIEVAYEDTFALRAERDLQFVRDRRPSS